jgi:hypothetical protein
LRQQLLGVTVTPTRSTCSALTSTPGLFLQFLQDVLGYWSYLLDVLYDFVTYFYAVDFEGAYHSIVTLWYCSLFPPWGCFVTSPTTTTRATSTSTSMTTGTSTLTCTSLLPC